MICILRSLSGSHLSACKCLKAPYFTQVSSGPDADLTFLRHTICTLIQPSFHKHDRCSREIGAYQPLRADERCLVRAVMSYMYNESCAQSTHANLKQYIKSITSVNNESTRESVVWMLYPRPEATLDTTFCGLLHTISDLSCEFSKGVITTYGVQ